MTKIPILVALLLPLLVTCTTEPKTVEVIRVLEVIVKTTRPVEITHLAKSVIEVTDTLRDLFYRYDEIVVTRILETELQSDLGRKVFAILENNIVGVDQIIAIHWSEGQVEIELVTSFMAHDDQQAVSWHVVKALAPHFASLRTNQLSMLTGRDRFVLVLTTYSPTGEHRYRSETSHETLIQLNDQAISFADWTKIAKTIVR